MKFALVLILLACTLSLSVKERMEAAATENAEKTAVQEETTSQVARTIGCRIVCGRKGVLCHCA